MEPGWGDTMDELSPEEASELIERGECRLLDVRESWEYEQGALPGAVHIPLGEISERYGEIRPEQAWIVYCHHGVRSSFAIRFLKSVGFKKLRNLSGGIDAWSARVDNSIRRY